MHPLLQNKYVKFVGGGLITFIVLLVILVIISSFNSTPIGLRDSSYRVEQDDYGFANTISNAPMMNRGISADMIESESSYYPHPLPPATDGYTVNLEKFEITNYSVTARTKQFDDLCSAVTNLKVNPDIHFKSINESTNNCRANLFVPEEKVQFIIDTVSVFSGVEIARNTESVTKQKERLVSQTEILKQQLNSVSNSLLVAEIQLDEIAELAKQTNDVKTLSLTIREKISLLDTLTQRKIQLTSQLEQMLKQSAELDERIGVVEFTINIYRSNPITINEKASQWESAWDTLSDEFTSTQIGVTVILGVLLLWLVRAFVYLLILIIVLRVVWKLAKRIWRM